MKFTLPRESFLKGLQLVQPLAGLVPVAPILENLLLNIEKDKISVITSDLSICMRHTTGIDVGRNYRGIFQARRFLNIFRELPEGEITIDLSEKNSLIIKCGALEYKMYALPGDDFPVISPFEDGEAITVDQLLFKEMLRKTSYAASTEANRKVLNGVHVSLRDQKLSMVATDGRRLALVEQEIEAPGNPEMEIVVPTKTAAELIKNLGDEGTLRIQVRQNDEDEKNKNMVTFEFGETWMASKLVEGKYPNIRQVIPGQCEERVTVERELFLNAVRRVSLISGEAAARLKVEFKKNLIKILAFEQDVGQAIETVPVKYSGKDIQMTLNSSFIIEPLRSLTSDEIYIELVDDNSPAVIKCNIPFLYVLMPLRMT